MIARQWIVVIFLSLFSWTAQADLKIGYVEVEKALLETSEGKKVDAALKKFVSERQKELQKREGDIRKMATDLERKKSVMSKDTFAKKFEEVQRSAQEKMMKLQDFARQSELEIQKKRDKLLKPLAEKMESVIKEIAKAEKYTLILKKSPQTILWAAQGINLTSKVVKVFEKKKKKK